MLIEGKEIPVDDGGTFVPGKGMVYQIDPIAFDGARYHEVGCCGDPERTVKYNALVRQWRIDHGLTP